MKLTSRFVTATLLSASSMLPTLAIRQFSLPPVRSFVLMCMDTRLDPAKYAGLTEGDEHVIRNDIFCSSCVSLKPLLVLAYWRSWPRRVPQDHRA